MEPELISPKELADTVNKNSDCILIDVRSPAEFESAHISGARNVPLGTKEFESFLKEIKGSKKTIYVTCQKGGRAKTACSELAKSDVLFKSLDGGMSAWINENLPYIEGKKSISIERQVRIGAGSLVVLGVLLFYAGFSNAILLSAFVGAGLIFAGVTDTCGMAMVLTKMPWNQSSGTKGNSCCMK
jgi:rhodanese-related sulfurtransferase